MPTASTIAVLGTGETIGNTATARLPVGGDELTGARARAR